MYPCTIETERLLLRRPRQTDAEAIYHRYACDPQVTRYLSWPVHRSIADTENFLRELTERLEAGREYAWAIVERDTGLLCGTIGCGFKPPLAAMGYCLARDVWGRGFAAEAAATVVPIAWSRPEIERLEAYCHTEHVRSARVLEKAGLHFAGVAKAHSVLPAFGEVPQDMLRFVMERPRGT